MIRAPVAPSGWPSEMPLPFGLTSPASQRSCRPVSFEELQHDGGERLVDLDHGDVVPVEAGPRERALARDAGCRGASGTGRRRRARTRRTARAARARAASPRPRSSTSIAAAPSTIALELPGGDLAVLLEGGLAATASFSSDVSRRGFSSTANEHGRAAGADLDGDDLALEAALVDRGDRAPVRLERVLVELLAREAPLRRRSPRRRCPAARSASARRASALKPAEPVRRRGSIPSARATSTRRPRRRRRRGALPGSPRRR